MRMSREALYLVGGAVLLMAAPVIQVAQQNLTFLVWHDFWLALFFVVVIHGVLISVLVLVFPNRLSIAVAVVLANWLSTYHVEMKAFVRNLDMTAASDMKSAGMLLLLSPVLIIVGTLLPRDLISRLIGALGAALFLLAAVPFALAVNIAALFEPAIDAKLYIDDDPLPKLAKADRRLPDIIYIVPDRYGSSSILADVFHHDNDDFLNALRSRGFVVAENERANYLKTQYSLASSMNMQYLEPLLQALDGKTDGPQPLYSLIQENLVAARLKQLGYRYIHVPTWWDGTRQSPQADVTKEFWALSYAGEFALPVLIRNPLVGFIIAGIFPTSQCDALKRQFAYLEEVGGDDRPTFTFAHVLAPHSPILTDADGRCIAEIDYPTQPLGGTWQESLEGYSGYVSYINSRFLEIFDRQKTNNPNPLIFVLQADEGPYPKAYREYIAGTNNQSGESEIATFDWRNASDAQLSMKFGILNALYLGDPIGGGEPTNVPDTLTPVNNWRVIFSHLEGKSYSLLPNRHFIFPNDEEPYNSIEISEQLNAIPR